MIGWMAAREHRVRVAPFDQLGRLAHRVRPGRAGRDRRVVRPLDPEGDRELAARGVDEDARDEARRNALEPAFTEDLALLHDPADAADRRAEGDPDPVRIEAVQPGVLDRFFPRCEG